MFSSLKQEIRQQDLLLVKLTSSDIATFISSLHKQASNSLIYANWYVFVYPLNLALEFLKELPAVIQRLKNSPFCIGMKYKNDNQMPQ